MKMMKRWQAALLAAAVVVSGAMQSPPRAMAAGSWWLPTSWLTASVGAVADVWDSFTGGAPAVAVQGGSLPYTFEVGPFTTVATNTYGYRQFPLRVLDPRTPTGTAAGPQLGWGTPSSCFPGSASGSNSTAWCSNLTTGYPSYNLQVKTTCVDGVSYTGGNVGNGTAPWPGTSSCASRGGIHSLSVTAGAGSAGISVPQSWTFTYTGGVALTTTTTLTCRNLSTGADTTVAETSEPAATVAPAPVCPAGTVAVRVRVTQSDGTVVSDVSVSTAALDKYGAYIGDPAGWDWQSQNTGSCYLQNREDPSMVIALSAAVCQEAEDGGEIGATPPPDCGTDIVCSAVRSMSEGVSRLLTGIASGISKVVSGVQSVVKSIVDGVQHILDGIHAEIDRIIQAIHEVRDAIVGGIQSILEKLQSILDGLTGDGDGGDGGDDGGGDGGTPPGAGDPGGDPDDLADKFSGWTDLVSEFANAIGSGGSGTCQGPAVTVPAMVHGGGSTSIYPLNACDQPLASLAVLCKWGLGAIIVLGGVMTSMRVLLAAIGLQVDIGRSAG